MKAFKLMHYFIGLSMILGGLWAFFNPYSPMGIPNESLAFSPFDTFTIPGIYIILFLGTGNILAGWLIDKKSIFQGYISALTGIGLLVWIVFQCNILQFVGILHILFFILGAFQFIFSIWLITVFKPFKISKRRK